MNNNRAEKAEMVAAMLKRAHGRFEEGRKLLIQRRKDGLAVDDLVSELIGARLGKTRLSDTDLDKLCAADTQDKMYQFFGEQRPKAGSGLMPTRREVR